MREIVYAENSEQFLWANNEQFDLMQKTDLMNAVNWYEYTLNMMCKGQIFINVEIDIINAEQQIHSTCNLKMKKYSDLAFKSRKYYFTRCFMRK